MSQDVTLTAVDLSRVPALMDSVNALATAMQSGDQTCRGPGAYLCPVVHQHLGQQCAAVVHRSGKLRQRAQAAVAAARPWCRPPTASWPIGARRHRREAWQQEAGRDGRLCLLPEFQAVRYGRGRAQSYNAVSKRFVGNSLWDDFLAYHYTGQRFTANDRRRGEPHSAAAR